MGEELIDRLDEQSGPGLEVRPAGRELLELGGRHQAALELISFANRHRSANLDHLDQADVDGAHGVRIVVEDPRGANRVVPLDGELLADLARRRGLEQIGGNPFRGPGVDRVHVSADTDGELVVKALFTSGIEPSHLEHLFVDANHRVGNDLLQRGRRLGVPALDEEAPLQGGPLEGFPVDPRAKWRQAMRIALGEQISPRDNEDELHESSAVRPGVEEVGGAFVTRLVERGSRVITVIGRLGERASRAKSRV